MARAVPGRISSSASELRNLHTTRIIPLRISEDHLAVSYLQVQTGLFLGATRGDSVYTHVSLALVASDHAP